jgi:hypothetical protein
MNTLSEKLNLGSLIPLIDKHSAISIPLLEESDRLQLLGEVRNLSYTAQQEYLPNGVREQLSSSVEFPRNSLCVAFAQSLEQAIADQTEEMSPYPFNHPFRLNELMAQHHEAGSLGITPHRDFLYNRNLIGVLIIEGKGQFWLCDDRTGTNARPVRSEPGDLILMRGPGFMGSDYRPMHFVDSISTERFTLGMRCCTP